MKNKVLLSAVAVVFVFSGCAGSRDVGVAPDGAQGDAGRIDGGALDAGQVDAGPADTGGQTPSFPYVEEAKDEVRLVNRGFAITFSLKTGYWDLHRGAEIVLRRVGAEIRTPDNDVISTAAKGYGCSLGQSAVEGGTLDTTVVCATSDGSLPRISLTFRLADGDPAFTISMAVKNESNAPLEVKKLLPAVLRDRQGGGLFVGTDPARHRILENGSDAYLDFYARLFPGDAKRAAMSDLFPWEAEGNSVSNLNHAIHDLGSGRGFVAGFLTASRSIPLATVAGDSEGTRVDEATGRKGFVHWGLESPFIPVAIAVEPGGSLSAEIAYVDAASQDTLDALERWASAVAKQQGIALWTQKNDPSTGKPYGVPNGWNSWTGSGGSGGYGSTIDEPLIEGNLAFMAREFEPFGMDWFQMDDGWQKDYGDWTLREDRFPPHGEIDSFQYLTGKIAAAGMKPGIWIAAFVAHAESETYKAHPDWFAEKDAFGKLSASGDLVYDFTKPETIDFIGETFERLNHWGFRWTKLDFEYWAMAVKKLAEPNVTPVEAYRRGLAKVRDTLGPDRHLLVVSGLGPAMGLADSNRLTLDNMPVWDGMHGIDDISDQGFKPTYRTVARRYYLSHRIWINHPDLIFFRPHSDPAATPLTLDEARAFCTVVAMTGGIVKIGEKLVEMKPDWIDTVRKLLPSYPATGRPLDLFEREFPEIWHLRVAAAENPKSQIPNPKSPYDVVSLINWGVNKDLTTNPFSLMPDAPRKLGVALADLGFDENAEYQAFEFWDQRYLGVVKDRIEIDAAPHRAYVVALRKKEAHPQLLGTNRHVLMGATDVTSETWDVETKTLSVTFDAVPGTDYVPFEHSFTVSVPEGFEVTDYSVAGLDKSDLKLARGEGFATLSFAAKEKRTAEVTVIFGR
ncbi:MAG: alpha-galactosidase [Deltaproteobacteria bacterium]|nr:alpha-galactosidase [Deltaproteobacteria bacterium]